MSCARKVNNLCTKYNTHCNIKPETMCAQYVEKESVKYCRFCFNSRIYKPTDEERMDPYSTKLTDENDFSSCSVGHCFSRNRRFMINSGHGHPVNITFEERTETMPEWDRVGIYYPKYCPECGRRLNEYDN